MASHRYRLVRGRHRGPQETTGPETAAAPNTNPTDPAATPPHSVAPAGALAGDPRRLHGEHYRNAPLAQRQLDAGCVAGPLLSALCFDRDPEVGLKVLENPHFGQPHARLLARFNPSTAVVDALSRRPALLADRATREALLRNPALGSVALRRLVSLRTVQELFVLSRDRNLPEKARSTCLQEFRRAYSRSAAEPRVELIVKTEGRCLPLLQGCRLDARTTQLLCARRIDSALLVQHLARFPATPAPLIAKLFRSPVARSQPGLRTLLKRHPMARAAGL